MTYANTKQSRAKDEGRMRCAKCRTVKWVGAFRRSKTDRIDSRCRMCRREDDHERYAERVATGWKRAKPKSKALKLRPIVSDITCCDGCCENIHPATPLTRGGLLCLPCRIAFIATKIPAAALPQGSADRPVSLSVSSPQTPPLRLPVEGLFVEGAGLAYSLHRL